MKSQNNEGNGWDTSTVLQSEPLILASANSAALEAILGVNNGADSSSTLDAAEPTAMVTAHDWVPGQNPETLLPESNVLSNEWHLNSSTGYDMNVMSVWADYTGQGITVGVVDSGVQTNHPDLVANYNANIDYDFLQGNNDGGYKISADTHGTAVSGVIAAMNDGVGSTGVAYNAQITSFRLVSNQGISSSQVRDAFLRDVDISNNSWGFTQAFAADSFTATIDSAFQTAVTNNRGGLGTNFVLSAGNSGHLGDNSNYQAMKNGRFTTVVGAANEDGTLASFSTPGTSVLVVAPGTAIYTTDITGSGGYSSGSYTTIQGTSFSAPAVSGVIALMLDANSGLGYRDVQEILASSTIQTDVNNAGWDWNGDTNWNGGGRHVHEGFGHGWVDAKAAVRLAETWLINGTSAGVYNNELRTSYTSSTLNRTIDNGSYSSTVNVNASMDIQYVELRLNMSHANIRQLTLTLTSPDGTQSVMFDRPPADSATYTYSPSWTFSSTHHWGETGLGNWTLTVADNASGNAAVLTDWTLLLYGDSSASNNDTYIYTDEYANFTGSGNASRRTLTDTSGNNDTLNASAVTNAVQINLTAGANSTIAGNTLTIASNTTIENAYGGDGNDTITGNSANNILWGGRGNDVLNGGAGIDTMYGGKGDDIYYVDSLSDVIVENANEGNDTVYSTLSNYVLSANVELLQLINSGSTTVTGSNADDVISGGSGMDSIYGMDGNDVLWGNDGDDTLDGSNGNDRLMGGAGNDTLTGGAGNDEFQGGAGADIMTGGDGNDIYNVDNIGDTITELSNEGTDTVYSTISYTLGNHVENLILAGSANLAITGNSLNNTLTGNTGRNNINGGAGDDILQGQSNTDTLIGGDGNDTLNGGGNADVMTGGAGDDRYSVDHASDLVTELLNEGTDTVEATISYNLNGNVEHLRLMGSGNINGTGNGLNNQLTGNTGNNILDGGVGNDTLSGGDGDDTLIGGSGNDVLYGNAGTNTMSGGTGADRYYVDSSTDTITENLNEGIDWVLNSVTHTLGANVEIMSMAGSGNINGTGNALDNSMAGNSGNNTIDGGDGNDVINGGSGNDTLIGGNGNDHLRGGLGNDILQGGAGNDTYRISDVNFGVDVITDTSGTETLDVGIFNTSAVLSWLAVDTNSDTFVDQLFLQFSGGNSLAINDYFNNTSADDDLSGTGAGHLEFLYFSNNWVVFSEAQAFVA